MPIEKSAKPGSKPNPFALSIDPVLLEFHREKARATGYRSFSRYVVDCLDAAARNPGLLVPTEETSSEQLEKIIELTTAAERERDKERETVSDLLTRVDRMESILELIAKQLKIPAKDMAKIEQEDTQEEDIFGSR